MDVLGRARGLVVLVEDQLTPRDVENAWDLLDANEVAETLRALSSLLHRAGEPRWAAMLGSLAEEAAAPLAADERRQLLVTVLGLYRGTGGLDDLVLQDAHGVRPEQPSLDDQRRNLHERAVQERSTSALLWPAEQEPGSCPPRTTWSRARRG